MLILDFLHYLSNLSNQTVGYLWCNVVFLHPCSLHSENMSYIFFYFNIIYLIKRPSRMLKSNIYIFLIKKA